MQYRTELILYGNGLKEMIEVYSACGWGVHTLIRPTYTNDELGKYAIVTFVTDITNTCYPT